MHSYRLPRHSVFTLALFSLGLVFSGFPQASGQVNILTDKMDNARTGQNTSETLLTTGNLTSNLFGKLSTFTVDGYVSAQPLYMSALAINGVTHNVVFVATEHDSVYAIDADSDAELWQTSLGTSMPISVQGCSSVTALAEVGILGTPVIDPTTNTLYVVAKTYVGGVAAFSLHALDVTTGQEKFGGPTTISATVGTLTFSSQQQLQRPGLLLSNGTIYIAFGSNGCDLNARGWLFAYDAASLLQLGVMTTQPDNAYGSSIWMGGVGPATDAAGNVYVSTANGTFNYSAFDMGDSILKLSFGSGAFTVADYFTPYDEATMSSSDLDLGSSGVTLLPYQTGSTTPDLLVASGKDEDIYLISTDSLGGFNPSGNTQIPQYIPTALGGQFFGNPLYWNNTVYFLAHQDYLRAYSLSLNGSGNSQLTAAGTTPGKLTTISLPVISANGTSNGVVWLVRNVKGVPLMSAYDATRLFLLYDSGMAANGRDTLGVVTHFATPIVANGKVYAGTQTQLVTYGLFPELNATAGNNQTGNAGSTLPIPLTVMATDPYSGNALVGVTVTFSDGGKKGIFSNPVVVTDSTGQASTSYTLPNLPQTLTVTATSPGLSTATFTEQDVVGPVATLSVVSGGKQSGVVGTTLTNPIVIKAKDAVGNVVPGASITFSDGQTSSVFTPNPATTGSNGQASTSYTLPTVAKSLTVTATCGSVSVKVSEQSTPGPATQMPITQGNNQTAHVNNKLSQALKVAVQDQYANGISGLTVTFTDNGAGGTFSTTTPVTNSSGVASVTYTTGSTPETVIITASYSTLSANFTETVTP